MPYSLATCSVARPSRSSPWGRTGTTAPWRSAPICRAFASLSAWRSPSLLTMMAAHLFIALNIWPWHPPALLRVDDKRFGSIWVASGPFGRTATGPHRSLTCPFLVGLAGFEPATS